MVSMMVFVASVADDDDDDDDVDEEVVSPPMGTTEYVARALRVSGSGIESARGMQVESCAEKAAERSSAQSGAGRLWRCILNVDEYF